MYHISECEKFKVINVENTDLINVATYSSFILFFDLRKLLSCFSENVWIIYIKYLLSELIRQYHCSINKGYIILDPAEYLSFIIYGTLVLEKVDKGKREVN